MRNVGIFTSAINETCVSLCQKQKIAPLQGLTRVLNQTIKLLRPRKTDSVKLVIDAYVL